MNRRELILSSTALGLSKLAIAADAGESERPLDSRASSSAGSPLPVPATGSIPVAFLISDGAVVIDFCGPWEVFETVRVLGRPDAAFSLYTVAESAAPVTASGGMTIVPNYTFKNAPAPKVVVIPAQGGAGEAAREWIRK